MVKSPNRDKRDSLSHFDVHVRLPARGLAGLGMS
jgi:hypothetical protein